MVAVEVVPAETVTDILAALVHTSMGEEVQQVRGAMAATAVLAVQRLTLAPVAAGHVTVAILAERAALGGL